MGFMYVRTVHVASCVQCALSPSVIVTRCGSAMLIRSVAWFDGIQELWRRWRLEEADERTSCWHWWERRRRPTVVTDRVPHEVGGGRAGRRLQVAQVRQEGRQEQPQPEVQITIHNTTMRRRLRPSLQFHSMVTLTLSCMTS